MTRKPEVQLTIDEPLPSSKTIHTKDCSLKMIRAMWTRKLNKAFLKLDGVYRKILIHTFRKHEAKKKHIDETAMAFIVDRLRGDGILTSEVEIDIRQSKVGEYNQGTVIALWR